MNRVLICTALALVTTWPVFATSGPAPDLLGRRPRVDVQTSLLAGAESWWVFFTDKGMASIGQLQSVPTTETFTERRKARLIRSGVEPDAADLPVAAAYLHQVERTGARIRTVSRWLNAVSVEADPDITAELLQIPAVADIRPVAVGVRAPRPADPRGFEQGLWPAATPQTLPYNYGLSLAQDLQLGVPDMHALGLTGDGVLIAVLDAGFRVTHPAFDDLVADGRVLAKYDFIFGDTSVADDSLDVAGQDQHGTWVLGTLAGFAPGELIGPAFGAEYLLAKTEDERSETPVEEDYYVAALEWADSTGADIVTSSLSYNFGYTLDGTDAISTVAANTAASRGILLCTAMGNSGPGATLLGAPADAFGIVAVGAVDAQGQIASFSSRGPTADGRIKPEVCARGVSAYTVAAGASTSYASVSGTSFATPLTAASAALLLAAHRDWGPLNLRDALMASGDHASAPDNSYGHGIFDLLAAVASRPPGTLNLSIVDGGDRYDNAPWSFVARATGTPDRQPTSVTLHYTYDPGATDSVAMTQTSDTLWTANVPYAGEQGLRFYLTSSDSSGRAARFPPTTRRAFEFLRQPDSLYEGFEFGGLRWAKTSDAAPPVPVLHRPIWWVSALDAASGDFALTDSPRGPYPPYLDDAIQTFTPLVVSMAGTWQCRFTTRFQLASGDTGFVERRTGSSGAWIGLDTLVGTVGTWTLRSRSFPADPGDSVFVRFRLKTDAADQGDGLYVDELRLAPASLAVDPNDPSRPLSFTLAQNYPNPFNPSTAIEFELSLPGRVRLSVYNVAGRLVRTVVNEVMPPGRHRAIWDGHNRTGRSVPSGVYFYKIETDHGSLTRKMLLVR